MTSLGTAHPTCERCGRTLKIEMLGVDDPDSPGDITQIKFKLPRHACRLPRPDDVDLREDRSPEAGAP